MNPVGTALRPRLLPFASLLFGATVAPNQTFARIHGRQAALSSPNGRYVLQAAARDQEPRFSITLIDRTTRRTRKVYEYDRDVSIIWSPDSRHFAINDYAGSNFTEATILSIDDAHRKFDVQDEILRQDRPLREKATLVGLGHDYFGVAYWLNSREVVVHHWGHNDDPPLGDFCMCYVYTLGGTVKKCSRQPKASDIEGLCWKTTP